jgi:hypothetical protein
MQIQLRQVEIVEALKQFIGKQGINLQNKTVEVSFTAGRKDSGLSADIVIEDCAIIPELGDDRPTLTVVPTPLPQISAEADKVVVISAEKDQAAETPKVNPATSLFN